MQATLRRVREGAAVAMERKRRRGGGGPAPGARRHRRSERRCAVQHGERAERRHGTIERARFACAAAATELPHVPVRKKSRGLVESKSKAQSETETPASATAVQGAERGSGARTVKFGCLASKGGTEQRWRTLSSIGRVALRGRRGAGI